MQCLLLEYGLNKLVGFRVAEEIYKLYLRASDSFAVPKDPAHYCVPCQVAGVICVSIFPNRSPQQFVELVEGPTCG